MCEIQRSAGDKGKMSEIRVVTPYVRPLLGRICGDAALFLMCSPMRRNMPLRRRMGRAASRV